MSFFDALFGRTRLKRPKLDPIFAVTAKAPDLEARGIRLEGSAALCHRSVASPDFARQEADWRGTFELFLREKGLTGQVEHDRYGYVWYVVRGDVDDVTTALHLVADSLQEAGYGGELLAAVFRCRDYHDEAFYLVYNYKRGSFYPFCPEGDGERRKNSWELAIAGQLEGILPVESELERWYALWDLPL